MKLVGDLRTETDAKLLNYHDQMKQLRKVFEYYKFLLHILKTFLHIIC